MTVDDTSEGRKARDEGMKRVKRSSEPWFTMACKVIMALPKGWTGIAEDANNIVRDVIGPPERYGASFRAWGSMINSLVKAGVLVDTGERRQMKNKRAHARQHAPVYIRPFDATPLRPVTGMRELESPRTLQAKSLFDVD